MAVEGLDTLQCCAEGVLEDILSELRNGEAREDGLAVELVCKPLEEGTCGLSVTLTNSGNDVTLVVQWGQVAGGCSRQGCLLSSPLSTRAGSQSYTMGLHTRPCLWIRNKL